LGEGTTQTQNKRTQTSTPRVGFESMIPAFERAKTVHALDRLATVIGIMDKSTILNISAIISHVKIKNALLKVFIFYRRAMEMITQAFRFRNIKKLELTDVSTIHELTTTE
jgi:hypothetical protein